MRVRLAGCLNVALLLLLSATSTRTEEPQTAGIATFSGFDTARFNLLLPPNASDPFVRTVEVEFRTSEVYCYLFDIRNDDDEEFDIRINGPSTLSVKLYWLSTGTSDSSLKEDTMDLLAPGVANGEWHHLSVQLESGGQLVLDGKPLAERLSSNFTARFPYNDSVRFYFGLRYRGCLANASLDEVVRVPLHSKSELLNQTKFLKPIVIGSLPKTGSGCRQAPCLCEPRGACIYRQWDLLDRCNCTRGYDPDALCRREWDTCKSLETGPPCLNGATCLNTAGVDEFLCSCARGFVGSRCQSIDLCKPENPCQNGGSCRLLGDKEQPESMNYTCSCSFGFEGRNCTESVRNKYLYPTWLTITFSAFFGCVFLLLLAGFVAFLFSKAWNQRTNVANQESSLPIGKTM